MAILWSAKAAKRSGLTQALGRTNQLMSLLEQARKFWRYYIVAWLFFPVLVVAVRYFGISLADWWPGVFLFSLAAGVVPWFPWFRSRVPYWPNAFWAILVPFVSLFVVVAVASALGAA